MSDSVEPTDQCDECGEWIYDEHNDSGVCKECEHQGWLDTENEWFMADLEDAPATGQPNNQ